MDSPESAAPVRCDRRARSGPAPSAPVHPSARGPNPYGRRRNQGIGDGTLPAGSPGTGTRRRREGV